MQQGLITAIPYACGLVAMVVWTNRAGSPTVRVAVPALIGGLAIPAALYLSNPWLAILAVTICACGVLAALPLLSGRCPPRTSPGPRRRPGSG